jgi:hypothetical protein
MSLAKLCRRLRRGVDTEWSSGIGLPMRRILCILAGAAVLCCAQSSVGASLAEVEAHRTELRLPLRFDGFHDDKQLGVTEALAGAPGFDESDAAYVRAGSIISVASADGTIRKIDFVNAAAAAIDRDIFRGIGVWDKRWDGGQMIDDRIVFDDSGFAYTILTPRYSNLKHGVLLFSVDKCRSWRAYPLLGLSGSLEGRDSFNEHASPPAVISFDTYGAARGSNLWLQRFSVRGSALKEVAKAVVSQRSLLGPNHSGGGNSTFTRGARTFVVFPSLERPDHTQSGTAIYARELVLTGDGFQGRAPRFLGYAGDISVVKSVTSDPHCIPAIVGDAEGRLHVVFGAHHGMLKYTVSKEPLNIDRGWNPLQLLGEPMSNGRYGSYTYVSLNMDRSGLLNIFARSEGDRYHFQLVQLQIKLGGTIRVWPGGLRHRVVAEPGRSFYAAWRQRTSMDRAGRLYLHFKYWPSDFSELESEQLSTQRGSPTGCHAHRCFYPNAPYLFPTTLFSEDGGNTFKMFAHGERDYTPGDQEKSSLILPNGE